MTHEESLLPKVFAHVLKLAPDFARDGEHLLWGGAYRLNADTGNVEFEMGGTWNEESPELSLETLASITCGYDIRPHTAIAEKCRQKERYLQEHLGADAHQWLHGNWAGYIELDAYSDHVEMSGWNSGELLGRCSNGKWRLPEGQAILREDAFAILQRERETERHPPRLPEEELSFPAPFKNVDIPTPPRSLPPA